MKQKTITIIVLADGETWSTTDGVSIVVIAEEDFKRLSGGVVDACQIEPIWEADLQQTLDLDEEDEDIKIKRCLICSGHYDTAGDYCPRCAAAADEDELALDLDL